MNKILARIGYNYEVTYISVSLYKDYYLFDGITWNYNAFKRSGKILLHG